MNKSTTSQHTSPYLPWVNQSVQYKSNGDYLPAVAMVTVAMQSSSMKRLDSWERCTSATWNIHCAIVHLSSRCYGYGRWWLDRPTTGRSSQRKMALGNRLRCLSIRPIITFNQSNPNGIISSFETRAKKKLQWPLPFVCHRFDILWRRFHIAA